MKEKEARLNEGPVYLLDKILYTVELQWLEHWWLVYHGCFEHVLESLGKNLQIWDNLVWFFFFML